MIEQIKRAVIRILIRFLEWLTSNRAKPRGSDIPLSDLVDVNENGKKRSKEETNNQSEHRHD